MRQLFISGPPHFDRRPAIAVVAPMAFMAVEAFTRAAIITHKNLSLLFLISRRESHAFLFELLSFGGRLTTAFYFFTPSDGVIYVRANSQTATPVSRPRTIPDGTTYGASFDLNAPFARKITRAKANP